MPRFQDAHQLAHTNDIRRRFADANVITGQVVLFGITSSVIPCPAAIISSLLCLQLKQFALGVALVLRFSVRLAMTMMSAGANAAISAYHSPRRWSDVTAFTQRGELSSASFL